MEFKKKDLRAFKILQIACETFGKPAIIKLLKSLKIFIGGRDDVLRSFTLKYRE